LWAGRRRSPFAIGKRLVRENIHRTQLFLEPAWPDSGEEGKLSVPTMNSIMLMRASIFFVLVAVALGAISSLMSAAEASAGVVSRLSQHVKARKILYVERSQGVVGWCDV
jgi:hypothetical protein